MNKKAALELSMNTIVVIVIAIVLLSLGLVFVRTMFGQINEITDKAFDEGKLEIGKIGHTDKFDMDNIIQVKQGRKKILNVYIANDGSLGPGSKRFTVKLTPNSGFSEDQVKAKIISSDITTLSEGQEATVPIQVAVISSAPLTIDASYQVEVTCDGCTEPFAKSGFTIEIEKGGLFSF